MTWDPATYLRFADHRLRPGVELAARIPEIDFRRIVDLGCGTGHLTRMLADRWRQAHVTGIDASAEMLAEAKIGHPDIEWIEADLRRHEPQEKVDLLFSNAALHWLDDHETLFPRIRHWLRPGGVMAIQMPNNWTEPTHTIPAEILDSREWAAPARSRLLRNRVASPACYGQWLQPADVDCWETTYHHRLSGDDPVLTWVSGSVLKPVLDALSEPALSRFREACRRGYAEAYPPDAEGVTTLPFRRLFLVAVLR